MNWDTLDYAAAAFLVGGGLAGLLIVRRLFANGVIRVLAGVAILAFVALIWVHLAVGIF